MVLAFYKVNNSQGYERDMFDKLWNKYDLVMEKLSLLNDGEFILYDMDKDSDRQDLVNDYNEGTLDSEWWVVQLEK